MTELIKDQTRLLASHQRECHVDAGRHARRRHDLAAEDHAFSGRVRPVSHQPVGGRPVGGGVEPLQQPDTHRQGLFEIQFATHGSF